MTRLFASLLLLPGLLFAQVPPTQPITVEADRLEMNSESGLSTYEGNVEMHQGSMLLRADTVVLHSRGNDLQMAVAQGKPVYLERTDPKTGELLKANAIHMEYRISDGLLEMKEEAHLWRGKDEFSGDHIIYELDTRVVRAFGLKNGKDEGRVRVILQPRKEEQQ
jgi:lipopolysaccharide export system protein LptA